jgi:peroxiredoxin
MCKSAQRYALLCRLICFCSLVSAALALADDTPTFDLPSDQASWINSAPLTLSALEGKGAVLYFFAGESPKCRVRWPDLMALSKKYEDKPVAFIGISSGNARSAVQSYIQQNKIAWPVIVDAGHDLDKKADVTAISADNFCQLRVITAAGKLVPVTGDDLEPAVQLALAGAAWKIDPAGMPEKMKPAWLAIEVGNYTPAGPVIAKGLNSPDDATKQAAQKLLAVVQPKIDAALKEAQASLNAGDKWAAAKKYMEIGQRFAGYTLPDNFTTQRAALLNDPQVKTIVNAAKELNSLQHYLGTVKDLNPAQRKRVENTLAQISKDASGTEVGKQADDMLTKLDGAK